MLNCPAPSLATGRSAPTGSDIPVSPAGDDARTPPVPRSGPVPGVELRLSEERGSASASAGALILSASGQSRWLCDDRHIIGSNLLRVLCRN